MAGGDTLKEVEQDLQDSNSEDIEDFQELKPELTEEEEISKKASEIKEHDVLDDEIKQADKIKEDLEKELEENDGWIKVLGNDSLMKKVG